MTWRSLAKGILIQILRSVRDLAMRPALGTLARSGLVSQGVRHRAARARGITVSDRAHLGSGVDFGSAQVIVEEGARIGQGSSFTGIATIRVAEGVEVPAGSQLGRVVTSTGGSGLLIHVPTRYEQSDFEAARDGEGRH